MKKTQIPMARTEGLVIQEMPDELLVYDLDANKAHCLNSTAAEVWKACNGENDIFEIAKTLNNTNSDVAEDLVWLAIDQLNENNLLEKDVQSKFKGLSRREVIKKVGITAAISLPVISMLSFPSVALASTCTLSTVSGSGDPGACALGETCCANGGGPGTPTCLPGMCP